VSQSWTLPELVREVVERIEALPVPPNGQVRAVPDARTVRYYATIGLLDRPVAMRGRTALYSEKHLAQVVAIKRLQHAGKSLAEIRELWSGLDAATLSRMSGVTLPAEPPRNARPAFWKGADAKPDVGRAPREPDVQPPERHEPDERAGWEDQVDPLDLPLATYVELRIELAPLVALALPITPETGPLSPADVRALRAAAAPLLAELANRGLVPHPGGEDR
jgi:DNA-binding transcriptional MerR regulator